MCAHLGRTVATHFADLHRRHVATHLGQTARGVRRNRHDRVVVTLSDGTRFSVALTDGDDRLVRVIGVGGARTANGLKDAIGSKTPGR